MASSRHPGIIWLTIAAILPAGRARPGGPGRPARPGARLRALGADWCG